MERLHRHQNQNGDCLATETDSGRRLLFIDVTRSLFFLEGPTFENWVAWNTWLTSKTMIDANIYSKQTDIVVLAKEVRLIPVNSVFLIAQGARSIPVVHQIFYK